MSEWGPRTSNPSGCRGTRSASDCVWPSPPRITLSIAHFSFFFFFSRVRSCKSRGPEPVKWAFFLVSIKRNKISVYLSYEHFFSLRQFLERLLLVPMAACSRGKNKDAKKKAGVARPHQYLFESRQSADLEMIVGCVCLAQSADCSTIPLWRWN